MIVWLQLNSSEPFFQSVSETMKIIYKDQETIASFSMLPVLLSFMPLLFNEFIVYQLIGLIGGSSDVILGWMNRLVDGWVGRVGGFG